MSLVLESESGALTPEFLNRKLTRIDIRGKIDTAASERIARQIENAIRTRAERGKCIFVFIHCDGGSVYDAFPIIDAMNRAKKYCTVATVINSKAFSVAALVFCSGSDGFRFASENASLMMHQAIMCNNPDHHPDDHSQKRQHISAAAQQHLQHLREQLRSIVTGIYLRTGSDRVRAFLDELHVKEQNNKEWYLSGEEMVHYGLADYNEIPDFLHDFEYRPRLLFRNGMSLPIPLTVSVESSPSPSSPSLAPLARPMSLDLTSRDRALVPFPTAPASTLTSTSARHSERYSEHDRPLPRQATTSTWPVRPKTFYPCEWVVDDYVTRFGPQHYH